MASLKKVFTLGIRNSLSGILIALLMTSATVALGAEKGGMEYLGVGVNVFKYRYPHPPVLAQSINPAEIARTRTSGRTEVDETYGSNFTEFAENLAVAAGLEGSYGGFSGSLDVAYDKNDRNSLNTKFFRIKNTVAGKILVIDHNPDVLKQHLTAEFKSALANFDPAKLFEVYGTHVIVEVSLGGEAEIIFNSSASESVSKEDFELKAKAAYEGMGGDVSAKASVNLSQERLAKISLGTGKLRVHGGSDGARQGLSKQPSPEAWRAWSETIQANPAFLGPRSLVPIWKLTEDTDRGAIVRSAFLKESAKHLTIQIFQATGKSHHRPDAQITIPTGYKLLSGGALIDYGGGPGNLLTASWPESDFRWRAIGKDHSYPNNATMTVYALALKLRSAIWSARPFVLH